VKPLKSGMAKTYSCPLVSKSGGAFALPALQLVLPDSKIDTDALFPHVPKRRDGDNRIVCEIDDIFALFTVLDEQKLFF